MAAADASASASAIVGGWVTGRHILHVESYWRTKEELPTGEFIRSQPFMVGGLSWIMAYYPNAHKSEHADFMAVFLNLDDASSSSSASSSDPPVKVKAQASSKPVPPYTHGTGLREFVAAPDGASWGCPLIRRDVLERSWDLLRDDCFRISCDVMIPRELRVEDRTSRPGSIVAVPPPDLGRHLGGLLVAEHGADVAFQVAGEVFRAHRCVLAARSPVFRAQLLGAMSEGNGNVTRSGAPPLIRVADMEPQVFRALLGFLYTDDILLPDYSLAREEGEAAIIMFQHLLVAADRYGMERLKLICEDTGNVATVLALAEQHNCQGLKKACFRFISSSPSALNDVMATDGFQHLARSCPSVLKELLSNTCTHLNPTRYRYRVLVLVILCVVVLGFLVFMSPVIL
ncbi:unnamed protein product [Urochloa decumbens]|uniref:Uncharacterized protein n=1 Tax=Urochloa decumbens TaxID=240449 RepID=A0ABC9DCG1_9POAL